jgi:large subunit ribosomal protein L18
MTTTKQDMKKRRTHKTRVRLSGKRNLARLSVFRSHTSMYAQIIDDTKGKTLVSVHTREVKSTKSRMEQAVKIGELVAKKAIEQKVSEVRFDRGGYKYHGLVKAIADGARKGGLTF